MFRSIQRSAYKTATRAVARQLASASHRSLSSSLITSIPRSTARFTPSLSSTSSPARHFSAGADHTETVPPLGDSISEGTVVEWTKSDGDYVEQDEVILVLETDKVSVDIHASKAGVLVKRMVEEGDTVEVGAELASIDTTAEAPAAAPAAEEAAPAADSTPAAAAPAAAPAAPAKAAAPAKKAEAAPAPAAATSAALREDSKVPLTRMRQTISRRMKEAQNTAASLTTFNEIDMTNIMALRSKYKDEFLEKHGCKLGFMSIFVKASTAALQTWPDVNAVIDPNGKEAVYRNYTDISVAVATPTGLVVPVLRDTQDMNFADVESGIAALGKKARDGQLAMEDMVGGTFTISNGGVYGSLMGTPILNMPQSAILGMHGIQKRPIAVGDKVEIRPMMYIALTYDHRIIDGGTAVRFLKQIKEGVENPEKLLLDL